MSKECLERIYEILEEMVGLAEEGEEKRVLELADLFKGYRDDAFSLLPSELSARYDNCCQSCYLGFTMFKEMKETYVKDAKAKFREINKPY